MQRKSGKKVKQNKSKTRPIVVASARRPRRTLAPRSNMDAGALAHARLLKDPCNAPMTGPVYSGLGTGQYRRFRRIIATDGLSVEGTYIFQLSTNTFWRATHVAATAGTNYTFNLGSAIFADPLLNLDSQLRCIAGCVKVRYVGTESARAGTIGLLAAPAQFREPGSVSSVDADQVAQPYINRVGEVQHEVRFVPNSNDELFKLPTSAAGGIKFSYTDSTCVVTFRGLPAQSMVMEVTGIYEVESSSGGAITSIPPASGVTLNQLLRGMGPVGSWAYGHVIAPTIRAMAGAAQNTLTSNVGAVVRAVGMLTI